MLVKAVINQDKLKNKLDGRSYKWLHQKINDKGLKIGYRGLCANLNNEVKDWKLITAMIIAEILDVSVEQLFDIVSSSD